MFKCARVDDFAVPGTPASRRRNQAASSSSAQPPPAKRRITFEILDETPEEVKSEISLKRSTDAKPGRP